MLAPLWAPESAPRPPVSTDNSSTAPNRTGTVAKNTVPPLLKPFEASLIPSTVTLTAPPGKLLYRVSPAVGGDAPGASLARARTLPRPARGNSVIVFDGNVSATNCEEVSNTCKVSAETVISAEAGPTAMTIRTSVV